MRRVFAVLSGVMVTLAACTSSANTPAQTPTDPQSATSSSPSTASTGPVTESATPRSTNRETDWLTYHGSADRAGRATAMPAVQGRLRIAASIKLDGAVYASPIVADGLT